MTTTKLQSFDIEKQKVNKRLGKSKFFSERFNFVDVLVGKKTFLVNFIK